MDERPQPSRPGLARDLAPRLRVAVVQTRSGPDPSGNLARLRPLLERLGRRGCDVILLPENVLCHGPLGRVAREVRSEREWLELVAPVARVARVPVVWGGLPLRESGRIFDAALVTDGQGRRLARYDKRRLFSLPERGVDETALYDPGRRPSDFLLRGWRCRLAICFDLRFPEHFRAGPRPDLLLCPAAFTRATGRAHWETLLRARAIENQTFLAAANQHTPARQGCPATYGHSLVADPWGVILDRLPSGPGSMTCELRHADLLAVRRRLPLVAP